ncbi:ankyrin repeat-containing domain protein [Mycena polygramma]|nr:ankyrin repeat-containing domain protein [Mycena polygramma]
MDIAGTIVTFGELALTIKESIEKVGDNKENLVDLKQEVLGTVKELKSLAQGYGDKEATGKLLTALETLTEQLEVISNRCQALAQSKGVSGFVKAWFKRDKIEAEINKLQQNRTNCYTQFQLFALARVEGTTARTGEHTVLIEATATRLEGYAARTEATTTRTEATTARTEANTAQLVNLEREKKIREWFQALDMREKQRATHALRHNDTGCWVLEGTKFAKWKGEPGCLWIRGNSGTGKSVLSSIAIDHLFHYRPKKIASMQSATPKFGIAYFYFDFRDVQKQLPENMLRSIIMQLSEQSPEPYSVLDQQFKSCQGGIFPPYGDLLAMLDTILSQFTGAYIVLDALDECSKHDELTKLISTLRGWGKPVHLLVASQPRAIFLDSAAFEGASIVVLERDTTHADILRFVTSELKLNSKLKHMKGAKDAAPKIVNKSNGMFRMAACLLQELARKKVDSNIDKILAKLPNDLFGIYTRFLESIEEDDFVYVAALLRWIAFSARPVTLRQLDEALAINISTPDQWVFEPENRERVEVVCGLLEGLVAVGPVSDGWESGSDSASEADSDQGPLVALAHSSVADYIMSKRFLDEYKHDLGEAPSHTFLAQSCVTYLLHFEDNTLNANTLAEYPLAQYAAQFWSHHLLRCHDRAVLQRSIVHLLEQGSQQLVALTCMYDIGGLWMARTDWSRHPPPPLTLCSRIGYVEGVVFFLDHGHDVDAAGDAFGNALQGAALKGHTDIVRLLLDHGADVNAEGRIYGGALQGAAVCGNVETVRVLLEKGANVNAKGRKYGSALQGAASNGYVDIVRILLEKGADVSAVGGKYGSALQSAASRGYVDTVRLLLEHGADVNAVGGGYGNALQGAAWHGYADIVRLILQHDTDMNTLNGKVGSALQDAALEGHVDIVRLLLDHGADVNAAGRHGNCALQGAAKHGHVDIVRILLEKGADMNSVDRDGNSVLQTSAQHGHMDIFRILLTRGADVHATSGELGNTLQVAAWYGHADVVRILLNKGADVNAAGGMFGSALAATSARRHKEIAELLREHGALDTEPGWQ